MIADLCIGVMIISLITGILVPSMTLPSTGWYTFPDEYIHAQTAALAAAERTAFTSSDGFCVSFNEKGDVPAPVTVYSERRGRIIIELGGGRLVIR